MINSKQQLVNYIRQQLGEPIIRIELTDEHIKTVIDETVGLYADVAYGDFEDTFVLTAEQAKAPMYIPNYRNILSIHPSGNSNWLPLAQLYNTPIGAIGSRYSTPQKVVNDVQFHWNNIKRTLTIKDAIVPELMIVIGLTRYAPDDNSDHIFDETWIKAMAKAKTQKLWGQILGKYSQNLVGGSQINYDRIISEAENEIERLMEELNDKWIDPAPIFVV